MKTNAHSLPSASEVQFLMNATADAILHSPNEGWRKDNQAFFQLLINESNADTALSFNQQYDA